MAPKEKFISSVKISLEDLQKNPDSLSGLRSKNSIKETDSSYKHRKTAPTSAPQKNKRAPSRSKKTEAAPTTPSESYNFHVIHINGEDWKAEKFSGENVVYRSDSGKLRQVLFNENEDTMIEELKQRIGASINPNGEEDKTTSMEKGIFFLGFFICQGVFLKGKILTMTMDHMPSSMIIPAAREKLA